MILLLDNYDSFTYMLQDYLKQLGPECTTWQHDQCTVWDIQELAPQAIVLSPGPKRPEDAGVTMDVIDRFHQELPLLGICLGHEAIGQYFGGKVTQSDEPVHGKTSVIEHTHDPVFDGLPATFKVMRYHSLLVELLPASPLSVIATTQAGSEVMAMRHQILPIYTFQFHPESVLTEHGLQLLRNWMEQAEITNQLPGS